MTEAESLILDLIDTYPAGRNRETLGRTAKNEGISQTTLNVALSKLLNEKVLQVDEKNVYTRTTVKAAKATKQPVRTAAATPVAPGPAGKPAAAAVQNKPAEMSTLKPRDQVLQAVTDGCMTIAEVIDRTGINYSLAEYHTRTLCNAGLLKKSGKRGPAWLFVTAASEPAPAPAMKKLDNIGDVLRNHTPVSGRVPTEAVLPPGSKKYAPPTATTGQISIELPDKLRKQLHLIRETGLFGATEIDCVQILLRRQIQQLVASGEVDKLHQFAMHSSLLPEGL